MDGSQGKGSEQTGNVGLEECPELGRGGGGLFKCCKLRGHSDSHHFTVPVSGPHHDGSSGYSWINKAPKTVVYSYRFSALHPPIQPYYRSVEEVTKLVNSYEYHPGGDLLKIEGPKVTVLSKFPRKYVIDEDEDEDEPLPPKPSVPDPVKFANREELVFWEQACLKWGIKKADEMLLERRKRL